MTDVSGRTTVTTALNEFWTGLQSIREEATSRWRAQGWSLDMAKKKKKNERNIWDTLEESKKQRSLFWWNGNWTPSQKTKRFVRRKLGTAHYTSNSTPTVKHGGGSVMLWRSVWAEGNGRLLRTEETKNGTEFTNFVSELASEDCQKHIDERRPLMFWIDAGLSSERSCHWKICIMFSSFDWAPASYCELREPWNLDCSCREYPVKTRRSCKLNHHRSAKLHGHPDTWCWTDWCEIFYDIHGPQRSKPINFSSTVTMRFFIFCAYWINCHKIRYRYPWWPDNESYCFWRVKILIVHYIIAIFLMDQQ